MNRLSCIKSLIRTISAILDFWREKGYHCSSASWILRQFSVSKAQEESLGLKQTFGWKRFRNYALTPVLPKPMLFLPVCYFNVKTRLNISQENITSTFFKAFNHVFDNLVEIKLSCLHVQVSKWNSAWLRSHISLRETQKWSAEG